MSIARQLVAEGAGTAALLAVVVGSGIMGDALAGGNAAVALLANSIATGLGLWVLIASLGPISGAHFNPAVSLVAAILGHLPWRHAIPYMFVQFAFAPMGVALAHVMFDLPLFAASQHARTGMGQLISEAAATAGLLAVILLNRCAGAHLVGGLVGAYIAAAYWFTASTSFANPAVTVARSLTNTFAGIRPADMLAFVAVQTLTALLVAGAHRRFVAVRS